MKTFTKFPVQLLLILKGVYQCCKAAKLTIFIDTFDNTRSFDLSFSRPILSYINPNLLTIVYTFGINGSPTGTEVTAAITTLLKLNVNVILVDWSQEAKMTILGTQLSYLLVNSPGAEVVGCQVGKAFAELVPQGLDGSKIYFIGHSLGAHLMGMAGRCAKTAGLTIPRITGLDPAGPVFEGVLSFPRIDRTCASFVDIIHTNPGNYGTTMSTGHVDIYPNYGTNIQPGCPEGNFPQFSKDDLCSHIRSIYLYLEGVVYPDNLPALGASDYQTWVSLNGVGTDVTYIGPFTNLQARGNYYDTTNAQSPFGKKAMGLKP